MWFSGIRRQTADVGSIQHSTRPAARVYSAQTVCVQVPCWDSRFCSFSSRFQALCVIALYFLTHSITTNCSCSSQISACIILTFLKDQGTKKIAYGLTYYSILLFPWIGLSHSRCGVVWWCHCLFLKCQLMLGCQSILPSKGLNLVA